MGGQVAYHALPGNGVEEFLAQATRLWWQALRRRSQRHRLTYQRHRLT